MFDSFLKVTSFYKEFLLDYYRSNPAVIEGSFDEQYKHLMAQGYGYADYFPRYMAKNHGLRSAEIIHNAEHLQGAWAREYGSNLTGDELLLEQIRRFAPGVLMIQDSANFDAAYLDRVRREVPSIRLMIGHCCSPYTEANLKTFGNFDVMLSCSPIYYKVLKDLAKTYHFPHALESSLVTPVDSRGTPENKVIFIGSLFYRNEFHRHRIGVVEEILKSGIPFKMFGILEETPWHALKLLQASYLMVRASERLGIKAFRKYQAYRKVERLQGMPTRSRYSNLIRENLRRDLLFGKKMLDTIAGHAVGFNIHGDGAGDFAANIRMFEVAGSGALLCTDHKSNIHDFYEPDAEILTFRDTGECIEKLKWAIDHPGEARRIAAAGQQRTLKDHSVERRVDLLYEIMKKEFPK